MRQIWTFIIVILILAGCVSRSQHAAMRARLDSINTANRSGLSSTVTVIQPYVSFFDVHGKANDRLLAYYLLGMAYYDHGEAPMALQYYQKAIDCADTTAADCDYAQLSRVYGQMGEVFYNQGLYRQALSFEKKAEKYAWASEDTLTALIIYEHNYLIYNKLQLIDSAIFVIEDVAQKFEKYGRSKDAAISLGAIVKTLIGRGEYKKAKEYMARYESESGYFNSSGDIEPGREIYYNSKGLYYLHINEPDSAEYYFRKELHSGKDFNNQNAAAMGLTMLYQELQFADSAAKYAIYAYAQNDSLHEQKTTETVERLQSIYDYSRNQEIAIRKSKEAQLNDRRWKLTLNLFLIFIMAVSFLAYKFIQNRRKGLKLYQESLTELQQLRIEKDALCQHKEEYSKIILEKNRKIDFLEQKVLKYGKQTYFKTANAERCLKESPTFIYYEKKAIQGQRLVEEDWTKLNILIREYLPGFDDFLTTNIHRLKTNEWRIVILLRLHFKAIDISNMIGVSKSQISQNCTEIMRKIFNDKGSSKELSTRLTKIF